MEEEVCQIGPMVESVVEVLVWQAQMVHHV